MCGGSIGEYQTREEKSMKAGASDIIPHECMMNDLMKSSVDNEHHIIKESC